MGAPAISATTNKTSGRMARRTCCATSRSNTRRRSVGCGRRRLAELLADGVADLVDLAERGQEVDRARFLAVVHLLAVHVHFEDPFVGGGEGDAGFAVVRRGQLSRHTDGYGEVPSRDAVDDLVLDLAFAHGGLL